MNLLIGVASQLATSIVNALSFERIQESEQKYRELVETANSAILRVNGEGRITYVNDFAPAAVWLRRAGVAGGGGRPVHPSG